MLGLPETGEAVSGLTAVTRRPGAEGAGSGSGQWRGGRPYLGLGEREGRAGLREPRRMPKAAGGGEAAWVSGAHRKPCWPCPVVLAALQLGYGGRKKGRDRGGMHCLPSPDRDTRRSFTGPARGVLAWQKGCSLSSVHSQGARQHGRSLCQAQHGQCSGKLVSSDRPGRQDRCRGRPSSQAHPQNARSMF